MIPSRPITTPKSWKKGKKNLWLKEAENCASLTNSRPQLFASFILTYGSSCQVAKGVYLKKKPYSQKLPSNSWRETNRTFHFLLLSELNDYLNITNLCIHLERVHNLTRFFCSLLYAMVALSKLILYCIIQILMKYRDFSFY